MQVPSKIEKEVVKKVKLTAVKGEERPDYLARLIKEVNTLEDDEFDALSPAAQDWCNAASTAIDKKQPVPEFASDKGNGKASKDGGKKKASDTKKVSKDGGEGKPSGGLSSMSYLRQLLATDPRSGIEDLEKALEKKGLRVPSRVTISTVKSDFRSSLRVLQDMGMLKGKVEI